MNIDMIKPQIEAYGILNLSRQTGISRPTIYRLLDGDTGLRLENVLKILDCLGLDLSIKQKQTKKVSKNELTRYSLCHWGAPLTNELSSNLEGKLAPLNINNTLLQALELGRTQSDIHTILPYFIKKNFDYLNWGMIFRESKEKKYLGYLLNLLYHFENKAKYLESYIPFLNKSHSKPEPLLKNNRRGSQYMKRLIEKTNMIAKSWGFLTLDQLDDIENRLHKWS